MVVSKSGVIYGLIMFYTLVGIFFTLYGNFLIDGGLDDILDPTYKDVIKEREATASEDFCTPVLYFKDGIQKKDFVYPIVRPLCVYQTIDTTFNQASNDDLKSFYFIPAIVIGISNIPVWINAIVFTPLLILFLYLMVTTILAVLFDGGS